MSSVIGGIHMSVWGWVVLAVIMIFIELLTMGLITIWAAGGALAAAVAALITDNLIWQGFVFAIVTLFFAIVTRPLAVRKLNNRTIKTNVDALVGKEAVAESDIDEFNRGEVRIEGKVWVAVPAEDSGSIRKGDIVKVRSVEGVKLIVSKEG